MNKTNRSAYSADPYRRNKIKTKQFADRYWNIQSTKTLNLKALNKKVNV